MIITHFFFFYLILPFSLAQSTLWLYCVEWKSEKEYNESLFTSRKSFFFFFLSFTWRPNFCWAHLIKIVFEINFSLVPTNTEELTWLQNISDSLSLSCVYDDLTLHFFFFFFFFYQIIFSLLKRLLKTLNDDPYPNVSMWNTVSVL